MSTLTSALDRILNWLQQHDPKTVASLQPGLTLEEIEEQVKILPFRIPIEIYELYQWRNGTRNRSPFMHEFINFLPLDDVEYGAISLYQSWSRKRLISFYLPIFVAEEAEDAYLVVGDEQQQESSPVFDLSGRHPPMYPSLTNMMLSIAECLETVGNVYQYSYSGIWENNGVRVLFESVRKKYGAVNPREF